MQLKAPRSSDVLWSWAIAAAVALVFGVVQRFAAPARALTELVPEQVAILSSVDVTAQHRAQLFALVALGVLSLVVALARPRLTLPVWWLPWVGTLGMVILLLLDPEKALGTWRWWCAGLLALCFAVAKWLKTPVPAGVVWVASVLVMAVWLLPGLLRVPPLFLSELHPADWHYSATLGQGDRVGAGLKLFDQVTLNYGWLPVAVQASIERRFGAWSFGGSMRLVQLCQVAFLALAALAFHAWRRDRPGWVFSALMLISSYVGTLTYSLYYPNQSGWRSLGFPIGVLLLIWARRFAGVWLSVALGGSAALVILYNTETGVALAFGFFLFTAMRAPRLLVRNTTAFVGCMVASVLFAACVFRLDTGGWPIPDSSLGALSQFIKFTGGVGGLPFYVDAAATVIFVHSAAVVARGVIRSWPQGLNALAASQPAIASMIMVWFGYFVHRPNAHNLWTIQFLYLFLISQYLSGQFLAPMLRRGWRAFFDPRTVLVFFVLSPLAVHFIRHNGLLAVEKWNSADVANTRVLSGVLLQTPIANELELRAQSLERLAHTGSTIYVSATPYMMAKLTGRFNPLSMHDVFFEALLNDDFERLVQEILVRQQPVQVLFDDRSALTVRYDPFAGHRQHYWQRLKDRLAKAYTAQGNDGGWEIWRRTPLGQ